MWSQSPSQWFVSERGVISGPFATERLRIMVQWGKLSSHALVCDESNGAWIPLRQSTFAADAAALATPEDSASAAPRLGAWFREEASQRRLCVAGAVAVAITLVLAVLSGA